MGSADRERRLEEIRYKYSYRGRLERFCQGRVRILPIRLAYEAAGSLLVGFFGGWQLGAIAFLSCLIGEFVEWLSVSWVSRADRVRNSARWAGRIVTIGSAAWAVGVSGGVIALWSIGGLAFWFLSFVFLFSALVNAQLVGGLHRKSLRIKQLILSGTAVTLVTDAWLAGVQTEHLGAFAVGAVVMLTTLGGLFVRLDWQNAQRHVAERSLIEAQLDLERSNEELAESRDRLKEHARNAESLAFESQTANRAKSKFLATMSREIRGPMHNIIKSADALSEGNLTEDQATKVGRVRRSATALLTIVGDILDLSKAESGNLKIDRAPFNLKLVWDDLIADGQAMSGSKALDFHIDGQVGEGVEVFGDVDRVRQILTSLVGNAIRATETGGVQVSLTTKQVGRELNLCFSVTDSGPGYSRASLSRLFDNLGDEGAGAAAGTALGLTVSRRLARLMGGDLRAQSEVGRGSTFTLILPLELSGNDAELPIRREPAELDLNGQHILLIEDSPDERRALQNLLTPTGAEISLASSSDHLLAKVYDTSPDLILYTMPNSPESELRMVELIRDAERESGLAPTRIVALVQTAFSETRRACISAGVESVVVRPVTRARLFSALRQMERAA